MRITTTRFALLLIVSTLAAACLGPVGSERRAGRGSGSGSGSDGPETSCAQYKHDVTIRSAADMDALPKTGCYDIYGKLTIQGSGVTSLAGLNELNSVDELDLDHTTLATIDTKRPVGIYGYLRVTGNSKLTNLKPLSFEIPAKGIVIDNNALLASLDPLTLDDPELTEVDGDLAITNSPALTRIALPSLTKVTGALTVQNTAVTTLDLSKLATTGAVTLADNSKLTTVTGFGATTVSGDFILRNDPVLASLGTMASLNKVAGNLTIDGTALANLAAFSTSVKYVDLLLTVNNNPNLTDLGALKHMSLVGGITITNNTNLSICRAIEIDKCVQHPTAAVINGNNNTNCNWQCN